MSRRSDAITKLEDAITKLEQERQKKQIEQTLEEASWDIPRLLKINARLVKEKHEQAEQIARLKEALEKIANEDIKCCDSEQGIEWDSCDHMAEVADEALKGGAG